MKSAIQTENLTLTLENTQILNGISLDISVGEYVTIIGPNGAGKTSLFRSLLGMFNYSGTVRVEGDNIRKVSSKELAKRIGYVPQTHDIEFPLTVYDFVRMGRYPYLKPLTPETRTDIDAIERAIKITGISSLRQRTLKTLSGGERQKVYIAAALAQETSILLLDEPATFLDVRHQMEIMTLLKKINTEHRVTLIAVNHDLNSAARWSDRIIGMKNGAILCSGTVDEILQPDRLHALFGTPFSLQETILPITP
jgi:iron complex transport system ATP-binding protein